MLRWYALCYSLRTLLQLATRAALASALNLNPNEHHFASTEPSINAINGADCAQAAMHGGTRLLVPLPFEP